jgi:hypothetical protein
MKAIETATKSSTVTSNKAKTLSEGQLFFKGTIAAAMEALDISRSQALAFTKSHSVTKLARVVIVAKILTPAMAKTMLDSKRGVDHVRVWFSPRQIEDLRGPRNILALAAQFLSIRKEADRLAAEAEAKAKAKAEAKALATQPKAA